MPPNLMTDTLIKGDLDTDSQRENTCDDGGRGWTVNTRIASTHQEPGRNKGGFSLSLEGSWLANASLSGSHPGCETISLGCSKAPVCGTCYDSPGHSCTLVSGGCCLPSSVVGRGQLLPGSSLVDPPLALGWP